MKKKLVKEEDFFKDIVLKIKSDKIISIEPDYDEEICINTVLKLRTFYIKFNDKDEFPGCCGLEVFNSLCENVKDLKLTSKQTILLYEAFFEWLLLCNNIHPELKLKDFYVTSITKILITLAIKSQKYAVKAIDNLALKYPSIRCLYMFKNSKTGNFVKMYCLNV